MICVNGYTHCLGFWPRTSFWYDNLSAPFFPQKLMSLRGSARRLIADLSSRLHELARVKTS